MDTIPNTQKDEEEEETGIGADNKLRIAGSTRTYSSVLSGGRPSTRADCELQTTKKNKNTLPIISHLTPTISPYRE